MKIVRYQILQKCPGASWRNIQDVPLLTNRNCGLTCRIRLLHWRTVQKGDKNVKQNNVRLRSGCHARLARRHATQGPLFSMAAIVNEVDRDEKAQQCKKSRYLLIRFIFVATKLDGKFAHSSTGLNKVLNCYPITVFTPSCNQGTDSAVDNCHPNSLLTSATPLGTSYFKLNSLVWIRNFEACLNSMSIESTSTSIDSQGSKNLKFFWEGKIREFFQRQDRQVAVVTSLNYCEAPEFTNLSVHK